MSLKILNTKGTLFPKGGKYVHGRLTIALIMCDLMILSIDIDFIYGIYLGDVGSMHDTHG